MKYVDQLNLAGKRVLIRVDFDVPISNQGTVADDTRIRAALPTIEAVLKLSGKVILAAHMGRPKGKRVESLSLRTVQKHLAKLLDKTVQIADDCVGEEVKQKVAQMQKGDILILENLRFHAEEEKNDPTFSQQLASLADVYVNDAFATSHRAHASTAGVCAFFKEKGAGFNIKRELEYFHKAFDNPARPLVAIFGGAKVSTKMAAIKNVAKRANKIIIGGAMANTFLVANEINVGKSLFEAEQVEVARACQAELKQSACALYLPVDAVVAKELKGGLPTKTVDVNAVEADYMILDVGPKTSNVFAEALQDAKTVIWNGPLGAFEIEEFSGGTFSMIDTLTDLDALTVVGGGDTDRALHERNAFDKMGYVSTAGGAFLELLEGKTLPALAALET